MNIASLGKLIKTLRKEKKMTQEDLASKLGVTISAVSKWETGKNSPDISILHELSKILEVSMEELYAAEETLNRRSSKILPITTDVIVLKPSEATFEVSTNVSETPKTAQVKSTQKFHSYSRVLIALLILLIIVAIGITTYVFNVNSEALDIRPYAFRNAEDEYYGMVYEMGCVYSGNLENMAFDDPFLLQLSDNWISNETVPADITIMKVSLYPNEAEALQWDTPHKVFYFIR